MRYVLRVKFLCTVQVPATSAVAAPSPTLMPLPVTLAALGSSPWQATFHAQFVQTEPTLGLVVARAVCALLGRSPLQSAAAKLARAVQQELRAPMTRQSAWIVQEGPTLGWVVARAACVHLERFQRLAAQLALHVPEEPRVLTRKRSALSAKAGLTRNLAVVVALSVMGVRTAHPTLPPWINVL